MPTRDPYKIIHVRFLWQTEERTLNYLAEDFVDALNQALADPRMFGDGDLTTVEMTRA
jgi:hypothetical protein